MLGLVVHDVSSPGLEEGKQPMCEWNIDTILCDLVLALVINTSAMLLGSAVFTFQAWYPGVASAFFTNVLLQLVLPVPGITAAVTAWVGEHRWRPIVRVFVENLIFVTCISLTMAFIQAPAGGDVIAAWLSTYVCLVLIGYVTSLILFAVQSR